MDIAGPSGDTSQSPLIMEQFSTLSVGGDRKSSVRDWRTEKDPRRRARRYQMDLCKKALDENTIVCLGTGCGKTHIAVLLIYEMGHLIKKPQNNICVFLAPTVALVQQQAKVIQDSIDFKVGTYCGSSKSLKNHHDWEKETHKYEVLVMTPQILLRNLSHCFLRIELIALLIFDECHHAQLDSNHPYAEIMKVFYKSDVVKLPRIFGMTASPKLGKGGSINGLETLLHAKVYSVEDKEELEQFAASPKVKVYYYGPVSSSSCHSRMIYDEKLDNIKRQCVSTLSKKTDEHSGLQSIKKMLQKLHGNLIFCLRTLGLWGALQATRILLKEDRSERNELIEAEGNCSDDSLCDKYLNQIASVFAFECMQDGIEASISCVEVLKEPFFSRKLLRLIGILSNVRLQPNMKCIVFVNRIVVARSLSYILQNLKFLSSWKSGFLVGVHSGLKSMSRKAMNVILERFRSGELNLLIATKVGEEGLDIQTCCLVIRFDLPETVASFIQSRGRARMPQSEYAFLVDSGNQKERNLIENFVKEEDQMNKEIASTRSSSTFHDYEERIYKVDSTGATISSGSSISLLHHYCSKLPHDEYFQPKPEFFYFDDVDGMVCNIILPSNAPIHRIVSSPQASVEAAKKDACLKACKELHERGALTDFLLPDQDEGNEGSVEDSSDSDGCEDEYSRKELHEMLVPSVLKESWTNLENSVCLNSYFVKFIPLPKDRIYKKFGLFVKATLPAEAERMRLNLRLARGRSVTTELVPSGVANFDKEQILQAQNFQHVCLKVILDRAEFRNEFFPLDKNDFSNPSSSTFYLLLPVIWHEHKNKMTVDWKLIKRCLSSPIFRTSNGAAVISQNLNHHLQLANGIKCKDDVIDSLVYVPCKDTFFFISDVLVEKNGYSPCKDSKDHVEHYVKTFGIHLSYPDQPLLKAKQLFCLDNLLRKKGKLDSREKEEHFIEIPPEICQLKIIGFSRDIGSSLSLLPSIMHRLESLLVAIELKQKFCDSFPEGAEVTASRVLEALTTEKCNESFSLERLEVLGDAFLKFAVGRHLFLLNEALDEGQLTRRRSNIVNNSNLFKLASKTNLQVYIRDQPFEPCQFFVLGRPCLVICSKDKETSIHCPHENNVTNGANSEVRCNKNHHWLHKKTIADVVEALVGAFIVDSGFKAATAFLKWIGIQVDFKPSQVNNIWSGSAIFMPLAAEMDTAALEDLVGHHFLHTGLLAQAFVHPSYNNHWGGCYQRLEFLGDAVLDYLITSYLFSVYPKLKPGQLTDLRSFFVNNDTFASVAVFRCFHNFIKCNSADLNESMDKYANFIRTHASKKGLVEAPKCKALGDLVESCIGAILLDTRFNLDYVWNIMLSFLDPIMSFSSLQLNPVRELQELCQSCNFDLQFPTTKKVGAFLVEAKVNGEDVCETASATSVNKKAAKRMAAEQIFATLKARGYRSKSKSLEEVLKSSLKMEAKLIGYDETPMDTTAPDAIGFDGLKLQEPSRDDYNLRMEPMEEDSTRICVNSIGSIRKPTSPSQDPFQQHIKSTKNGSSHKGSAKSSLYEICAANCWKPPLFECCEEKGPGHLKEFTFKVVLEIEEAPFMVLECYGQPQAKKKDAADHAAEGALWYLKHQGYLPGKL